MLPRAGGKCPAMARDDNFPTLAGELKVLGDSHRRQHCFPGPRGDRMYHLRTRDKSIAFSPETLSGGEKSTHVSNHSGTGLSSTVARSCKPRGNARAVASAARELYTWPCAGNGLTTFKRTFRCWAKLLDMLDVGLPS